MTDAQREMVEYIMRDLLRRPGAEIGVDTPLVSSGLVDSLAVTEILAKLEDVADVRIPAGRVRPADMDSVAAMFLMAQRIGRPRRA